MSLDTPIKRRILLKSAVTSVPIVASIASIPQSLLAEPNYTVDELSSPHWAPEPSKARYRIDGLPKVLGKKLYARDFRARDFNGWPAVEECVAYPIRCDKVAYKVMAYNIDALPAALQPIAVLDAKRIRADGLQTACGMKKPFFCELGQQPDYYGQPVAILIFKNWRIYRKARKLLQFNTSLITYSSQPEPPAPAADYNPVSAFVRDDMLHFSRVESSNYSDMQASVAQAIKADIKNSEWAVFKRDFQTQVMDPMFMEPEAGLAWYNKDAKKLHLVLGTQSPIGDISEAVNIFSASKTFPLNENDALELVSCYPGGGFGGRDKSYFTFYLALAAPYTDGAPLRWSHTRYEQFQVGLKRHLTDFSQTLAFDHDGIIKALDAEFVMNGGGRKNLSPYVASLAALSSISAYEIPRACASGKATDTRDLVGGSQRGFGGPQAFIATETMIDEAAEKLKIDPFALRRKNLLNKSSKIISGAPVLQDLQLTEILDDLEAQPLWRQRFKQQKQYAVEGKLYGVGFALSNQAYGTSGDGMFGGIELDSEGRICVRTTYIDMGNGAATALGLAPAKHLGRNANTIKMGDAAFFDALGLTSDSDCQTSTNGVLKGAGSSSACLGAFHQFHAVEQAAYVFYLTSVLPAVSAIVGRMVGEDDARWQQGQIQLVDGEVIAWSRIAVAIQAAQLPTYVAIHATFIAHFASAEFDFQSGKKRLPIDYVATGREENALVELKREGLENPPPEASKYGRSTYAPCGALIALSVDPDSGQVVIEECISTLSAGAQISHELISGQSQGGIAMAIGYTLLEDCPITEDGPGNGLWNLDKYRVPKLLDIPKKQTLNILPPAEGETTARGIAEAVMCPIAPAILNALAMATKGHRFTVLPVKPSDIKAVLS